MGLFILFEHPHFFYIKYYLKSLNYFSNTNIYEAYIQISFYSWDFTYFSSN